MESKIVRKVVRRFPDVWKTVKCPKEGGGGRKAQMCYSRAGGGSGKMGLTLTSRTFHQSPAAVQPAAPADNVLLCQRPL